MNRQKDTFWNKYFGTEAGYNLSWGSVFAGVVSFFAVLMLFSLITSAIGFGTFSPTSAEPFKGMGTGVIIWSIISLLVSLFAGGFVAGLAARKTGMLHGFLTWSLAMVLMFALLTSAVSGVVGVAGKVIGATVGVTADTAGAVVEQTSEAVYTGLDKLGEQIGEVDTEQLQADVEAVLRDTDVEELQPEYLAGMLEQSKDEIVAAAKEIAVNPDKAETIIEEVAENLKQRAETLAEAADKDAIKSAVAKNSDLSEEEADEVVENIYNGLKQAAEEAQVQIDNARKALTEAKAEFDAAVQDVKETTEEVSDDVAKYSVMTFVGLLLAMILTSFAGYIGSKKTRYTAVQE